MSDSEQNPASALGTVMSWIGSLWVVFAVLWGVGVIEALGVSGPIASGLGSTIFPALVLIGVGRLLRKRARVEDVSASADVPPARLRTPPILPKPQARFEVPPPIVLTAPKPPRTVVAPRTVVDKPVETVPARESSDDASPTREMESATKPAGRPKTSQEMIEEARQRWGTRP